MAAPATEAVIGPSLTLTGGFVSDLAGNFLYLDVKVDGAFVFYVTIVDKGSSGSFTTLGKPVPLSFRFEV